MVKVPDSKLKCFMRRGKGGGLYRTCATPEKNKQPKKQVRGDPKPASQRKLPYLTTTGKSLPKRQGPPVAPKPKKKKSPIKIDVEKARKAGIKVDVEKAKKAGNIIKEVKKNLKTKPKVAPKSDKVKAQSLKDLEERLKKIKPLEEEAKNDVNKIKLAFSINYPPALGPHTIKKEDKELQDRINKKAEDLTKERKAIEQSIKKLKGKKKVKLRVKKK